VRRGPFGGGGPTRLTAAYDRRVSSEPTTAVIDLSKPPASDPSPAEPVQPAHSEPPPDPTGAPSDVVRRRLATVVSDRASWVPTGFIVLLAGALRITGLQHPPGKIFDEIYYAEEAHELLRYGVEWKPENNAGDFVVHPPLGKWIIALGEQAFGYNAFGWRISAAIAGTISVLLLIRIGRRLFNSTVLGCAAGLLMALDGLHFVLSRAALLDIFLTLFVLATFGCLLLDRDWRRARWLAALEAGTRPARAIPWWRVTAGIFIGCALAVKLSAAFFVPAFVALAYMWQYGVYRTVDAPRPYLRALRSPSQAVMGVLAAAVYLASWTGWFRSADGSYRHHLANQGQPETPVVGALLNLFEYHKAAYNFHVGLNSPHDYQSWPWQWLLMGRPVAFYWDANPGCGAEKCAAEVLLLGTPALWWAFVPALAALAWFGIALRDRRAAAIGIMIGAALLPWFYYHYNGGRTMFVFYALPALPFLVLALVYVLGAIMGPVAPRGPIMPDRRMVGVIVAAVYILLVAACFAYFHPIYVGDSIPHDAWWSRMWLGRRWV